MERIVSNRLFLGSKAQIRLLEVFFVLAFSYISYSTNIYIIYGASVLLFWLLVSTKHSKCSIVMVFFFTLLIFLYTFGIGFSEGFRVLKSFVMIVPFYLMSVYRNTTKGEIKLPIIAAYMKLSAIIVIVDFCLYYLIGKTIGRSVLTGPQIRPSAFFEDSNFFCYTMLSYIMFLKYTLGKKTKLYIISILISSSLSAIIVLCFLLFVYKRKWLDKSKLFYKQWKRKRRLIIITTIMVFGGYFLFVQNSQYISIFIRESTFNPAVKVKLWSMMLRFESQSSALEKVIDQGDELFGAGAGTAKTFNELNMNLHNTYYQILVEMGIVLGVLIIGSIMYYMVDITNLNFLLLFCTVILLGNMLEVYYAPVLQFIYFLFKYNNNGTALQTQ